MPTSHRKCGSHVQILEYSGGGSCSTYGGGDLENSVCLDELMELLKNGSKITKGPEGMDDEWMSPVGVTDPELTGLLVSPVIEDVLLPESQGALLQKIETGLFPNRRLKNGSDDFILRHFKTTAMTMMTNTPNTPPHIPAAVTT